MSGVNRCWCYDCNLNHNDPVSGLPSVMTRMILCPTCGNKRCPRATNHRYSCTGSNEIGQPGSRYTLGQPVPTGAPK